jgi:MATE family multidrug resistance protein
LDFPELGLLVQGRTIASRFVMFGYMHYMMKKKENSSFFREVFFKKIKKMSILDYQLGAPSAMQMFF